MSIAAQRLSVRGRDCSRQNDILLPKKHPSAFFGTPLGKLSDQCRRRHAGGDRLHDIGMRARQRRRCVRLQFPGRRAHDAVYDRSRTSHAVNLFDMSEKYADVFTHRRTVLRARAKSRTRPQRQQAPRSSHPSYAREVHHEIMRHTLTNRRTALMAGGARCCS